MPPFRPFLLVLGMALLVILTVVIAISGDVEAAQEVVDTEWIVNSTEPGTVDTDYIMRANLTITGTGQISFLRCGFKFMSEAPGKYGITVQPGGYLIIQSCILEAGFLEPGEQAEAWTFYVKDSGRLSLQASTVMDLGLIGGVDREKGLALETNGAYVVGSTFSDCNRGIIVMSGAAPIIANNTFENNNVGIEVKGSASSLTSFNTFEANIMGMLYTSCTAAFLRSGSFNDNMYGVRAVASNLIVEDIFVGGMGTAVSSEANSWVVVGNSTIVSLSKQGKAVYGSDLRFIDCTVGGLSGQTETDLNSHLLVENSVHFHVVYAGVHYPVEDASVELTDSKGEKAYQQVTGSDGTSPTRLVLVFEQHNGQPPIPRGPFHAEASSGFNFEELDDLRIGPNEVIEIEFVDDEPPDLTVLAPAPDSLYNTSEVEFRGRLSDLHSGISSFYYTVDGGTSKPLPIEDPWQVLVNLPEGKLALVFVAVDLVGNTIKVPRTVTVDTMPPLIISIDPPDGSVTREYSLLVIGETEPGTTLTVDGEPLDVQPDGSFSGFISLGDDEGEQLTPFHLVDAAGNEATHYYTVFVDRTPPDLTVNTDPDYRDFPYVNNSLIRVFGTTEPGVRVVVTINTILAGETFADDQGDWSVDIDLDLGENDLVVDAYDEAGNRNSVEIIDFYYDIEPPEITILLPENGTMVQKAWILVKVRSEEGATIWVNDQDEQIQPAHGEVTFPEVPLSDVGENALVIYARDRAGNLNTETVYVIREVKVPDGGGEDTEFPYWILAIVVGGAVAALFAVIYMRSRSE